MVFSRLTIFFVLFFSGISCTNDPSPWAFSYPGDAFTDSALLDLRYLNEDYAGQHGFIGLSEDGESFLREDGEPIRFWPVNGGSATRSMDNEELAWHARFLAKQGVNMNRWHGSINPAGKGTRLFEIDTAEAVFIWRFVAAMKREGIYTTISPFWAHNGHMGGWVPEAWGIEGYSGKDDLWEVMYFNDRLKEAYKQWVKYLYTEENPYTGVPLRDEPAVALVQIKNEDGVFFWTMQGIRPELERLVGRLFAEWTVEKYGSLAAAYQAWEGEKLVKDDPVTGILGIYPTWEMVQEVAGGKAARLADQTEFYAHRQRGFYNEIHDFYRYELGCRQLINPNNWKTASPEKLNDLERYTYLDCEVPAVNRYYDPGHYGENNGWRIDPGHFYQGISCLKQPLRLPVNVKQTAGAPFLVTESGWNLPHIYQSEAPSLIGAYQSLTGVDGFYWFSISSRDYMEFPYFEFTKDTAGMYAMNRWTYSTPGGIAQFPAYALMYRNGYIRQGEVMVHEVRNLESLWRRESPLISEESSFDPNRDQLDGIDPMDVHSELNPYAFLTGPVKATYGGDPAETYITDQLPELVDMESGTVESVTGELFLDHRHGIFRFESEKAAGLAGFLGTKGNFSMEDLSVRTSNHYISIGVVSMDQLPLDESSRILVQTGTTYRPLGWEQEEAQYVRGNDTLQGYTILNTGKMPWMAQPTRVEITLRNRNINRAVLLDLAGYPVRELDVKRRGDALLVDLPPESLYVMLMK
ncbi:MAG: hypothetical protein P1P82_05165 [Bacteroidales bacterium]|nr:hypothetical protein [Bacteroidales bacterium]MDT8430829.1 hypothetical protein [Bacteroidales bacterium]